MSSLDDIDTAVCKKLNKVFPECIKIDYYDIFQGYDIRDIVDNLIDDLMDGFLDIDRPMRSPNNKKTALLQNICLIVFLKSSGATDTCSMWLRKAAMLTWQALAVSMLIQKWNVVDSSAEKLKGCLRDYY